ncbi:unnamed protein product, partial [Amoebophrya sp. A25]|eukprot:GSA25T00003720001.1
MAENYGSVQPLPGIQPPEVVQNSGTDEYQNDEHDGRYIQQLQQREESENPEETHASRPLLQASSTRSRTIAKPSTKTKRGNPPTGGTASTSLSTLKHEQHSRQEITAPKKNSKFFNKKDINIKNVNHDPHFSSASLSNAGEQGPHLLAPKEYQ